MLERDHGGTTRTASGMTELKLSRLQRRALKWVGAEQRFPTRQTARQLVEQIEANQDGGPTLVQQACLTTHMLLQSEDERTLGVAAKIVVDMERINQTDEREDEADDQASQQHVHFHQHAGAVLNDNGVHTAARLERIREAVAERRRVNGVGTAGGD